MPFVAPDDICLLFIPNRTCDNPRGAIIFIHTVAKLLSPQRRCFGASRDVPDPSVSNEPTTAWAVVFRWRFFFSFWFSFFSLCGILFFDTIFSFGTFINVHFLFYNTRETHTSLYALRYDI